jgi:hypothetical protein|tara:strand:- start:763 stop:870 length:108 start_codon:yes stop_codon:yes gene_type:complete
MQQVRLEQEHKERLMMEREKVEMQRQYERQQQLEE